MVWRPSIFGALVDVYPMLQMSIPRREGCVRSPTLTRDMANEVFIRVMQSSTLKLAFVVELDLPNSNNNYTRTRASIRPDQKEKRVDNNLRTWNCWSQMVASGDRGKGGSRIQ